MSKKKKGKVTLKKKDKVTPKKKAEIKPKKKEKVKPKKKEELAPRKKEVLVQQKKAVELKCSVVSCGEKAKRSFSSKSVEGVIKKAGLKIEGNPTRIQLCDKHYRAIKKELKREKKTEKMRQGLPF
ncbi:MAG: hypothetical protein WED07_03690 [Candidatus Freyarchaeum deiterrae]